MKKILLPLFIALILCLVSDTTVRAITAANSSPTATSPPGNISNRFFVQESNNVMRASNQGRTLTFVERVAYQRAIEEVYWRHRIWPKENAKPKPSLNRVMLRRFKEDKMGKGLNRK